MMPPPLSSLCGRRRVRAAEPTAAPADGNVAVGSHGKYFPTLNDATDCLYVDGHVNMLSL